jgi:hypothetical protein
MGTPSYCVIELNSFARGICVNRWSGTITAETTPAELIEISRRCLMTYWKEDDDRVFVPQTPPNEETLTPDEVVVRAPDGRAVY